MGWQELQSNEVLVSSGDAESRRFGFQILNAQCGAQSEGRESELSQALSSEIYELAVVRYPVHLEGVAQLLATHGKKTIDADPTVYWGTPIRKDVSNRSPANIAIQRIDESALEIVEQVINSAFSGYRSHWHDNPRTQNIRMEDAYNEWVKNKITNNESRCYLMLVDGEPAGFAMTETRELVSEILLAGICTQFQSRGLYRHLLAHIENEMFSEKSVELVISTQSQNRNVQKAWDKYGLIPLMTVRTVHVENRKS
jgi:ribosomal protein S18 acetylase RimI-like enzyme